MAPFAILLLLGGVGLIIAIIRSDQAQRKAVSQRVTLVAPGAAESARAAKGLGGGLRQGEIISERLFGLGMRHQWSQHSRGRALLVRAAGAAAVLAITSVLLRFPGWAVALLALAGFMALPRVTLMMEQNRAEAQFTDLFPNAIDMIIRMLRAGLPITAAVRAVGSEGTPPINKVFARIADQVDIGIPLADALSEYGQEIDLPDFRFFSVAVGLQHTTGGNLTLTLEILSEIIRKRRSARMRAKAVTAEVRMTAYVLAAIPVIVVAGLLAFNPAYLAPLFHDRRGNVIAGLAVGSLTMGLLTMRHMMRSAMRV